MIYSYPRIRKSHPRYNEIVAAFRKKYPEATRLSNLHRVGTTYCADLWKGKKRYYPPTAGGMVVDGGSVSSFEVAK